MDENIEDVFFIADNDEGEELTIRWTASRSWTTDLKKQTQSEVRRMQFSLEGCESIRLELVEDSVFRIKGTGKLIYYKSGDDPTFRMKWANPQNWN